MQGPDEEEKLADTVQEALNQIEKKQYAAVLQTRGFLQSELKSMVLHSAGIRF